MALTTELQRFAEAFKSEDELRRTIAVLLGKMGRNQDIQITHGTQEYGKDIVFYSQDGVGERILNACVIKNEKITGSVDDTKGARTVFNQVDQALDTPFLNSTGEAEHVARVYVISPFDCSQTAIRSIQGKLEKRSGQITFLCGSRLFEKFAEFFPEFLLFESTLMTSYIAAIQKTFEQNDPINFLISQHNIFAAGRRMLTKVYVRPNFKVVLQKIEYLVDTPDLRQLEDVLNQRKLNEILESLAFVGSFLSEPQVWQSGDPQDIPARLASLASSLKISWNAAYEIHRDESEKKAKSPIPRNQVSLKVKGINADRKLMDTVQKAVVDFGKCVTRANNFVDGEPDLPRLLHSENHLNYCRIQEVCRVAPGAFRKVHDLRFISVVLPEGLMDLVDKPLLITAPAGYGKTSFCKWNTLADADRLISKSSDTIPIYIPLHQLATIPAVDWREAFLGTAELEEIVRSAQTSARRVRLYLDGLDEVTTIDQQKKLMALAAQIPASFPKVQIVVTARDYVSGPWLRWLARVHLAEMTEGQISELIVNWLGENPEELQDFRQQLLRVRTLGPLMRVPLLGTLILAVFKKVRSLPENRVKLYEIFVELMCGGWDLAKNVRRESKFGADVKLSVLTRLAGLLQINGSREAGESDIRKIISSLMPVFIDKWRGLLDEILEDGLLIRMGLGLTFSHLSFQEFLAAKDLTDPTGGRQQHMLEKFLLGENWWRGVLAFYVATSRRPDEMETWIRQAVARFSHLESRDLSSREDFLINSIKESFPGWKAGVVIPD